MKVFAIASAVFSIFTAIASAQEGVTWTKPLDGPEEGNTIFTPGLYQKVPVGKPFEVTWQPTTQGTISIVLYKGPGNNIIPQFAIASKIPNTGSYFWTPDTTFPDVKEGYGLRIIVDGTGQHRWSTQFGFSNPENPSGTGTSSKPTGTTTATATGSATGTVNTTSTRVTTTSGLGGNRTTTTTRPTVTNTASRNSTLTSTTRLITSTTEEASTTTEEATTTTTSSDNAAVATAVSYGMGVIALAAAGMALF